LPTARAWCPDELDDGRENMGVGLGKLGEKI
jgi:hypothetical protein